MLANTIRLGKVFGIEISIDLSWLVIVFLVGWSFFEQFGSRFADLEPTPLFLLTMAAVAVFFGSVLLHELSHSVVARRLGIPVEGITLFLFGGVTKTKLEASRPRDEFFIAVVGPLTSVAIAGILWSIVNLTGDALGDPILYAAGYLGWLNLALGLFNLLPGFPLDGGRVLRSILWRVQGDVAVATRGAAKSGKAVAIVMIGFGLLSLFAGDFGGLWMAAIGWFLLQAATAADQDVLLHSVLRSVAAKDLMSPNLVTIDGDATIREAVDDYFLRYDHSAFPVVGATSGLLHLRSVRQIPLDQWEVRQVWSVASSLDETCTVTPDAHMDDVIDQLRSQDQDRVLVVDEGQVVGIITPRDIARWVRRSQELGMPLAR